MYAILRAEKHKSVSAVARSARHTFRERPTLNADGANAFKNRFLGSRDTKDLLSRLSARLPESRRRDAVLCIEYLITASPEAFIKHGGHLDDLGSGYFADALAWLRARHGQDNVLAAAVHLDETTPHLVAYVVPLTQDARLSARDFLGGPKAMRAMQDSFFSACGQPHGLLRGVRGSKAHHTEISKFYTGLQGPEHSVKLTRLDYAAKALGHETEAWKQAQAQVKQIAQQATAGARQRKALHSRTKALANIEAQSQQAASHLQRHALEQAEQDLSLGRREQALARRQHDLDMAVAQAEAAERLLELYEQRSNSTPELNRKKIYSPIPTR
ncbi:MobV family relaxase [Pseudomonas anguilliseptica]|uniref:MobV family relaxase n=1 Tax=Pseudomonas anguilliseptica TaxID=53406 RepID=UPI001F354FD4|nr:MobV family relaxase [Pseudomonas anguilliseptica]MCE5364209.1 plasmid recombination protein [Pseudomonas anguilliseptica]